MGIPFAAGIQHLFDATQRFTRAALPVYLRVKNFPEDTGAYLEVGVPFTPTGEAAFESGFTDMLVQPPPSVKRVSMHNIGLLAGRLNFGAVIFRVSDTFVRDQMRKYEIDDGIEVFRDRDGKFKTVGFVMGQRLYSIEAILSNQVAAQTINWDITCNRLELRTDAPVEREDD